MKPVFVFLILLTLKSALSMNRGYIFTAPKRLLSGSVEFVCLSLHNLTGHAHVDVHVPHTESDEKIASTHHKIKEGVGTCLELYVPPTQQTRGRLHLQARFDDIPDYNINSVKEVHIQHDPHVTFIETDKPVYKPGQQVLFRVLSLKHDLSSISDPISKVWIESPSEVRLAQWLNISTQQGIAQLQFQLSHEPQQGAWKIRVERTKSHPTVQTRTFEVLEYVLPRFQVSIKPPDYVLADAEYLFWTICAKYSYGQPVKGELHVKVVPQTPTWRQRKTKPPEIHFITELESKDGCYVFNITGSELGLTDWDVAPNNVIMSASVTETGTENVQTSMSTSSVIHQALKLDFPSFSSQYFKPGLPYKGKVKVVYQNNVAAVGEVIQLCLKVRGKGEWSRTLVVCKNFTSDSDGFVRFLVPPQHHNVVLLSFVATAVGYQTKYYSPDKRWRVFMDQPSAFFDVQPWYSPTDSYIEIADNNDKSLHCDSQHTFHVYYTTQPNITNLTFYYLVKSRGDLIHFGRLDHYQKKGHRERFEHFPDVLGGNEDTERTNVSDTDDVVIKKIDKVALKLDVLPKMAPFSYLMVYYVREDGETVATTHTIHVHKCFANQVRARFFESQQFPGSEASLRISAAPHSLCAIAAVDKSTSFLATPNIVDSERVFRDLARFHIDSHSVPRQRDHWEYCAKKTSIKEEPPVDEEESHARTVIAEPPFWDLRRRRSIAAMPPSKFVDAIQAFDEFGAVVMSDLTLETRPCTGYVPGDRDGVLQARTPKMHSDELDGGHVKQMVAMSIPLAFPLTVGVAGGANQLGYSEDARQPLVEIRSFFPETWLWELVYTGVEGRAVMKRELPHSITDWVATTLCVSPQWGLGISQPTQLRAFQPFFLDYTMPYSIKRSEVLQLRVSLFNFLSHSIPVKISFEESPGIELLTNESSSVACVGERSTLVVKFRIRALDLGEVNMTVSAEVDPEFPYPCGPELLINRRDVIVKPILVQPEGFPVEITKSSFICPKDFSDDSSIFWNMELPLDIVEDSARAEVSVVGDLLGSTLQNLDHLVRLPMGCGEQNMILFVPNLHVINYLNATEQLSPVLKAEAIKNMEKGYQRELNYRHTDGSYSAFGNSDTEGSMWLTAFVVKSFAQARPHIFIDEDDLKMSMRWITKRQLENGCFPLVGQVFHKDMKGGLTSESSSATLTAFVLISLLETGFPLPPAVTSNALFCLRGDKDPDVYTLALTTYALTLLGQRQPAEESLRHLLGAATNQQDLLWWEKPESESLGLNIEITAYGILSMIKLGGEENLINALRAVRWVSKHRNANGGFVSTQDTVVALEALTKYATVLPSSKTDLNILVTATEVEEVFRIRQHERLLLKSVHLPVLPTQVEVVAEGEGCALIQSWLRYNVRSATGSEVFEVEVETGPVASVDECSMQRVEACVRYKGPDNSSNMAVLEVKMVTGYAPDRASLHKLDKDPELDLKRWEEERDQVNFYFEQLSARKQCVGFLVVQETEVENPAAATVRLYDYYRPQLFVSTKYSTDAGCKSERLPHPEPDVSDPNSITNRQGFVNADAIRFPQDDEETTVGSQADNVTMSGLNPQFVDVDHELETPDGQEGPSPVYVQPQTYSELFVFPSEEDEEAEEEGAGCPQCTNSAPEDFSSLYCSSVMVYKLVLRKASHARLLLELSPRKSPVRLRRVITLSLDSNCTCSPLRKVGSQVLILLSSPSLLVEDTNTTAVLAVDGRATVFRVVAQPGQPDVVKHARSTC